jgi:hypothetical protein
MNLSTLLIALGLVFGAAPLAFLTLYALGMQHERQSLWWPVRALCQLVALFTGFFDVLVNSTVFSVYFFRLPNSSQWTLQARLERLAPTKGWRGKLAHLLARLLNAAHPGHNHIKSIVLVKQAPHVPPRTPSDNDPTINFVPPEGFSDLPPPQPGRRAPLG